jgi:hypothetical protein
MKALLTFFATILLSNSFAQTRLGFEGGLNIYRLKHTVDYPSINYETQTTIGFRFGVIANIPIDGELNFQPCILFTSRGGKGTATLPGWNGDYTVESSLSINYIEIPLMLAFKFNEKPGGLFIGVGPGLNIALSGKNKGSGNGSDDKMIKFGSDSSQLKPIDLSVDACLGYDFNDFLIKAGFEYSFTNLSNIDGEKIRNKAFTFSVSYFIIPQSK